MKRRNQVLLAGVIAAGLMMSWSVSPVRAVPPDPDNAALLYYQAFLMIANLDEKGPDSIGEVARGKAAPDDKAREYIDQCRGAIEFAEAARDLKLCHWGFRYSKGFEASMPYLAQMRRLAFVLIADARVRAADGDYRAALDRCLMMDSFSRHVGDDTLVSYLVSVAVRRLGYECMESVIGQAAGDAELLGWLKGELATTEKGPAFPITAMKIEREIALATMTTDKIQSLAKAMGDSDEGRLAKVLAAADEQTLAEARRVYSDRFSVALAVLASDAPYDEAHRQLGRMGENVDPNDPVTAVAHSLMPALVRVLTVKTTQEAYANAVQAGVDICLQRARTGSLPAALPAGLPKDPFSGKDFRYERTAGGFVLRCPGKDLDKDTFQEFQFTVK
jgi:hypothetical protein